VSTATGHQVGDSKRQQGLYIEDRKRKLAAQEAEDQPQTGVLSNVRIYINGYLENITDIEMKRIIARAGGQVV